MFKIIKRNGREVDFDKQKIVSAIDRADKEANKEDRLTPGKSQEIAKNIENTIINSDRPYNVEEIQNMVEQELIKSGNAVVSVLYIRYRYKRELVRGKNTTYEKIMSLISLENEDVKQENSNKNPVINSTQRDYIAGIVNEDIAKQYMLPEKIVEADEKGIIHVHDKDYFAMNETNCCLVNLEDMLQNGTVINGTMIEKPKSFSVACNIATQSMAQIASSQYGGQSINIAHLAPFVDVSRQKFIKEYKDEFEKLGIDINSDKFKNFIEDEVKNEIKKGVQIIQYQINTLMTCNGQTPFVTVFMYLGDAKSELEKDDLALIIEEMLRQRYLGTKNEEGVYISPAFPKLIYVLDEDNAYEGSKYFYLTKMSAKCSAKRMVPDYISAKVMRKIKEGNVYSSMGCVDGDEVITYKINNNLYVESFKRMWFRLSLLFEQKCQYCKDNPNLYMDLKDVYIFDTSVQNFVICKRIIRNISDKWMNISFSNGRILKCTVDHPFEIIKKGLVRADNLQIGDKLLINNSQYSEQTINQNIDIAWILGFILCDGCYKSNSMFVSIAAESEDDIELRYINIMKKYFNIDVKSKLQSRGTKGIYKDLIAKSKSIDSNFIFVNYLNSYFGGTRKLDRQIPNEVFSWDKISKLSFLAGMIDADGYINATSHYNKGKFKRPTVQIGSTNKELSIQQMLLAQSCGMPAKIYKNHYNSSNPNLIRFRVEFEPCNELISMLTCYKKISKYYEIPFYKDQVQNNISEVVSIEYNDEINYSYDVTTESEHFEVSGIYSHNCRSFLAPWYDENNKAKFWGRFNIGVTTINLPHVALSSGRDKEKFWKIFDERLELCYEALMIRYKKLLKTPSDVAPIMWQYGAISRLKKGEPIGKLFENGYCSISLGYAGLYECVYYMEGKSHTDPSATPFAIEVMEYMNRKVEEWKERSGVGLGFSIYGTPIESTTYKFAKANQRDFGIIPEVTEYPYITNSYHINVREEIDAFHKLEFESQFQNLSTGGAISYVEIPNMQNNLDSVVSVLQFIYEHIMYAELNTKSDYCYICEWDGEIKIVKDEETGKLVWECPRCGNRDQNKMDVARRTCGLTAI